LFELLQLQHIELLQLQHQLRFHIELRVNRPV
jgi:hypothetical protein